MKENHISTGLALSFHYLQKSKLQQCGWWHWWPLYLSDKMQSCN